MNNSHDLKDPFKFIDDLWFRLKQSKDDLENKLSNVGSYPTAHYYSDMRELDVIKSILNWMDNYKE